MPSPTTSLSTRRPDLESSFEAFDLAMDRQGFIASQVLTVIDVRSSAGKFGKIPVKELLQKAGVLERAPSGGYSRGSWNFEDASYVTKERGWEEPIDDNERAMYAEYFDAELIAGARARDAVLRGQEQRVADAVFNTTTWTGAALTTAAATKWDVFATATPIDNVLAAKKKVYDGTGLWPNALVISRKTFLNLRECAQIVDRIKYSGLDDPKARGITAAALAQVFDLQYVLIAGAAKNTANEAQTPVIASLWADTMAQVCRVAETSDFREPCIGRTFHWAEDGSSIAGTVESYRDEKVRGDVIRCRHQVDEQILYKELGHLLTNVG